MDELLLVLRVLLALAAVGGALWWLQRRARRGRGRAPAERPVRVLARQGIAAKAQVVIVEADGRRLLLGVTEHSVNVLRDTEINDIEINADMDTAPATDTEVTASPSAVDAAPLTREPVDFATALERARSRQDTDTEVGAAASQRPRDEHRRARAARSSALEGSILDVDTWRQAAAALRTGRAR